MEKISPLKNPFAARRRRAAWDAVGTVLVFVSFVALDLWIRHVTRSIGKYPLFFRPAILFTVCWAALFSVAALVIPNRTWGRVVYGILYFVSATFAVVQDVYYQLMGSFLYFSDFLYAGEGRDYLTYVTRVLDLRFAAHIAALILLGAAGILLFPRPLKGGLQLGVKGGILALSVAGICLTPGLYGEYRDDSWDSYNTMAFEYDKFINSTEDMELTGLYQYAFKNVVLSLQHAGILNAGGTAEGIRAVDAYFDGRPAHQDNQMTGLLAGKNVIVVMMESMDDWLITPEDTPALYWLREHGMSFEQMYTPEYANGYTFNTEFAAHVGVYPYTNSNAAYGLAGNAFPLSLANLFAQAGYRTESYHRSNPDFYNRGIMHGAFGYEEYHGFYAYSGPEVTREDDRFLPECDDLYRDMTESEPFLDFVITYSPHLPYDDTDPLTQDALAAHPEYAQGELTELQVLKAKARLTDDMFALLLRRLEEDGLLDDTVIVAFADHYAYALSDQQLLLEESVKAGSSILQRTPFIIWSRDLGKMTVDKTVGSVDITPTLANLFGLPVPERVMGRDAFDPMYEGYVIFPGGTWISGGTYVREGTVVWNDGLSQEDIDRMNVYVRRTYEINDTILDTDYYRHLD